MKNTKKIRKGGRVRVHFDANTYSVPDAFAYKALILKAGSGGVRIFDDCRQIWEDRGVAGYLPCARIQGIVKDKFHSLSVRADQILAVCGEKQITFPANGLISAGVRRGLHGNRARLGHHGQDLAHRDDLDPPWGEADPA